MSTEIQRAIGVGAVLVAVLFLALDNVLVVAVDENHAWVRFLLLALLCVAAGVGIFLFLIPWAQRDSDAAERLAQAGFVTGLVALASLIVFPTALPFVLGAGAFVLGRLGEQSAATESERDDDPERRDETQRQEPDSGEASAGERATQGWVATMMGGLSFLACLVLYVILLAGG